MVLRLGLGLEVASAEAADAEELEKRTLVKITG